MQFFKKLFLFSIVCFGTLQAQVHALPILTENDLQTGAQQMELYLPKLEGKRVAIVANVTSRVGNSHLVDTLLKRKVQIKKIFSPEHGFRGTSDAGEKVKSGIDEKTKLPIVSLYGNHKKPTAEDLKNVDVVIYDIQDVGVRFYTFISTMTYVMEACAENKKTFIVLDRPNPHVSYVDGPVLEPKYKSFLGMHAVPLVYGMTCGEYARMLNGEKWLSAGVQCELTVIPVKGYSHNSYFIIPSKPSPNLPNDKAIILYPSLGLFEGTIMSLGRGTDFPFQVLGHPEMKSEQFSFTPHPNAGAKEPKYNGLLCKGYDLRLFAQEVVRPSREIYLFWLIDCYKRMERADFFDENFNYHSGNDLLQQQIKDGVSEEKIRESWKPGITQFKTIRKKYLLYTDFE